MAGAPPPLSPLERAARELFLRQFNAPPTCIALAPGRLELLGNHTDYNQGLVLAIAVDRGTAVAVAPRKDGKIELVSSGFPERALFAADNFSKDAAAPWTDYVKGVLRQLRVRGVHFTGFNAAIHSDIPPGAGMSSSAALLVATALAVRQLQPYRLAATGLVEPPARDREGALPPLSVGEKLEMAKLCQAAEHEFVGVQCGVLDYACSLFGKEGNAIEIDCQSLAIEHIPMAADIAVIVCPSGVRHTLAEGGYNELRGHCEGAARALGARSLRSVDAPRLAANKDRLTARQHECARHIVGEIQRVVAGTRALRDGDFEQFGQFMFQSHESSRDSFHNSCPELDALVEIAREHPACLGARLTGGGFGGATINLVRSENAEAFIRHMAQEYERVMERKIEPLRCRIADGVR